jgi:hypothetical protein
MLKFTVQTFYQLLFSHSFPFRNSFPFSNSFPFPKLPTPKSPKQKKSKLKPKPQETQASKAQGEKQKASSAPSTNSCKQGGAKTLGKGCDIVTGKTCLPPSLNASLGDAAVLLVSVCGRGCAYLGLQVKAITLHLALLSYSSHRLFIICSPYILPCHTKMPEAQQFINKEV